MIAERVYECQDGELLVQIAQPEPSGDDWGCSYTITRAGKADSGTAFGVDSLQALMMAIAAIQAEVTNIPGVTFLGGDDLFLTPA